MVGNLVGVCRPTSNQRITNLLVHETAARREDLIEQRFADERVPELHTESIPRGVNQIGHRGVLYSVQDLGRSGICNALPEIKRYGMPDDGGG